MWRGKKGSLTKVKGHYIRRSTACAYPTSIWRSHILRLGSKKQILIRKKETGAVLVHTFDPNIGRQRRGISVSLRPDWSIEKIVKFQARQDYTVRLCLKNKP